MLTRFRVVRMEVSICSPIHTTATSQFCIPVSSKVFFSRFFTTTALSVSSRISCIFSSSLSITSRSASDSASSSARAYPKRPRPTIPYDIFSAFFLFDIFSSMALSRLIYFLPDNGSVLLSEMPDRRDSQRPKPADIHDKDRQNLAADAQIRRDARGQAHRAEGAGDLKHGVPHGKPRLHDHHQPGTRDHDGQRQKGDHPPAFRKALPGRL